MKNSTISISEGKKEFKKLLYIGDIHWSHLLKDFVDRFDKSYYIVLCGDLFDRGYHSAEVYETVRNLYEQWRLTMVQGNHDLFLSIGFGMRWESRSKFAAKARSILSDIDRVILCETFTDQFYSNGGEATMISFAKAYGTNLATKVDEIIDFLMQFGLYTVDPANNLVAHGTWIMCLVDGSLVWETIGGQFISGFDYVRELNIWFRNLDRNTLFRLTARERELGDRIYADMERNWAIRNPEFVKGNWSYPVDIVPTWFSNRVFTDSRYIEAHKSLRIELDCRNLGRMICGHWLNDSKTFGKSDDPEMKKYWNTILRLDRSYIWLDNFGFAVIDVETNKVLEMGDSWYYMMKKRAD